MATKEKKEIVTVCRQAHFNAAHRLYNPRWDDRKNELVFGKCANKNYHGHNYNLIVKVSGPITPDTGYVIDLNYLSDLINEHIIERYDHKNLNLDVPDFRIVIPTAENIVVRIWNILRPILDPKYSLMVILYETERNFFEYTGPSQD